MTDDRQATTLCELIGTWLPRQRWFAAKGGDEPALASAGELRLHRPTRSDDGRFTDGRSDDGAEPADRAEPDVDITVHFVTAAVGDVRATYQVPLTYHRRPVPELEHALVGVLVESGTGGVGGGGRQWVYDGPHDPAFVRAWLALVVTRAQALSDDGPAGGRAIGVIQPDTPIPDAPLPGPDRPARVLSGEQSNTSVIVGGDSDPDPVIVKVFRVLQSGANPDVAVTSTLTSVGCPNVPRLTGWVEGEWLDPHGGHAYGHLASVSEFLPGSDDAWRLACVAVETGQPFVEQARKIGEATAAVHKALARALPTSAGDESTLGDLADHLQQRLSWALEAVPALQPYAAAARAAVDAVRHLDRVPRLQRIHGDLHLGQVLDAGPRGWVLLDFEGEPLRPLADRNRQDLALRDVAGMLRSFDYAARHAVLELPDGDPRLGRVDAWAAEAAEAFLAAYATAGGQDPREDAELLRALELDKALYEAVYETRNRPAWVQIPFCAITRLLSPAPARPPSTNTVP
jgi:trehalose synthase-fused probable maltokinase